MSVYFEHTFRDGTSVRFLTKPFEPAKKEVPTIEFNFVQGGALRTLNTRLYDADEKKEFAGDFCLAVMKYLDWNRELKTSGNATFLQNVGDKIIGEGEAVVYGSNEQTNESGVIAASAERPKMKFNLKKKECVDCGNVFMPRSGRQKTCDECKRKKIA